MKTKKLLSLILAVGFMTTSFYVHADDTNLMDVKIRDLNKQLLVERTKLKKLEKFAADKGYKLYLDRQASLDTLKFDMFLLSTGLAIVFATGNEVVSHELARLNRAAEKLMRGEIEEYLGMAVSRLSPAESNRLIEDLVESKARLRANLVEFHGSRDAIITAEYEYQELKGLLKLQYSDRVPAILKLASPNTLVSLQPKLSEAAKIAQQSGEDFKSLAPIERRLNIWSSARRISSLTAAAFAIYYLYSASTGADEKWISEQLSHTSLDKLVMAQLNRLNDLMNQIAQAEAEKLILSAQPAHN